MRAFAVSCAVLFALGSVPARAAQTWVFVVSADNQPGVEQVVRKALSAKDRKLVDGAWVVVALAGSSNLGVPNFHAAPPAKWPKELREDWQAGHAACQARADALTTTMKSLDTQSKMMELSACADTLRIALWNRWLQHEHVDRVVEVTVTPGEGNSFTKVSAYAPGDKDSVTAFKEGRTPDPTQDVRAAISEVLAGKGTPVMRSPSTQLPEGGGPAGDANELNARPERLDLPAIQAPAGCAKLPAKLALNPADTSFSKTLAARYAASASGAEPELPCTLNANRAMAQTFGMVLTTLTVNLACAGHAYRAEVPLDLPMKNADPWDQLSAKLIRAIFQDRCAK